MTRRGILYGVGVGPGDPELMTVKAWRIVSQAPVIAYPAPNGKESLARKIASPFIPGDAIELPVHLPMCSERDAGREAYDAACPAIIEHLDHGRDVAFLCEGDPFFYGSFMYLFARIAGTHETVVVPGVTSITACAGAIGRPLVARNDVLIVLPAPLSQQQLRDGIAKADAVAIMKVGQHFDKVRDVLDDLGLAGKSIVIEKATLAGERITRLSDVPRGERPYFSTILVYKGGEPW
jgi:precorrin-2/cobalt-factor-2 C20-methyltransferase